MLMRFGKLLLMKFGTMLLHGYQLEEYVDKTRDNVNDKLRQCFS